MIALDHLGEQLAPGLGRVRTYVESPDPKRSTILIQQLGAHFSCVEPRHPHPLVTRTDAAEWLVVNQQTSLGRSWTSERDLPKLREATVRMRGIQGLEPIAASHLQRGHRQKRKLPVSSRS